MARRSLTAKTTLLAPAIDLGPTEERRYHATIERVARPISDEAGRSARPYRAIDTLVQWSGAGRSPPACAKPQKTFAHGLSPRSSTRFAPSTIHVFGMAKEDEAIQLPQRHCGRKALVRMFGERLSPSVGPVLRAGHVCGTSSAGNARSRNGRSNKDGMVVGSARKQLRASWSPLLAPSKHTTRIS